MTEINADKYHISYVAEEAAVFLRGALLLNGAIAYEPILQLLKEAASEQVPEQLIVDIRDLKFLNSSGINMMTKFIMYISDTESIQLKLKIVAYKKVAWQARLAINLQRLLPTLNAELID